MSEPILEVSVKGERELVQSLDQLSGREMTNRTKRATRAGAGVMRKALRAEASHRSDLPRSFRKTATKAHRNPIGVSTGPSSSLINIFEPGAKSHHEGDSGQLLHSQQGVVPIFAARGPVPHPGFAARPLIGPVFDRTHDEAADAAIAELARGL